MSEAGGSRMNPDGGRLGMMSPEEALRIFHHRLAMFTGLDYVTISKDVERHDELLASSNIHQLEYCVICSYRSKIPRSNFNAG